MSRNGIPQLTRRTVIEAIGASATIAVFGGTSTASENEGKEEHLVGVQNGYEVSAIQEQIEQDPDIQGVDIRDRNDTLAFLRSDVSTDTKEDALSKIGEIEGVKYTEFNDVREPVATQPNDPKFDQQYAPQLVNAPDAWDITFGSEDVTISIIDTGADYTHPDLESQFGSQKGRDFVDNDGDPAPGSAQHGTHVAGIASASTDDGTGVAGISNSTLLSCRALGPNGGRTSDIADAIEWSVDQGADIINMSLGGGGFNQTMKNAVSYAWNQGVLLICAAGNHQESDPPDQQDVSYPAAYEECIAVAAVDRNKNHTAFSNYGEKVDIAAPGNDVLSTVPGGDYAQFPGTSMASPAVAGVAALGLARHDWSASQARQNLIDTAQPLDDAEKFVGAGLADAYAFVTAGGGSENEPPIVTFKDGSRSVSVDEPVTFNASGSRDPDGEITNYRWEFGDGSDPVEGSDKVEVNHTFDQTGEYTVSLTVTDNDGAESSASVDITVTDETKERITDEVDSSLAYSGDGDQWTYSFETDDPLQFTISIEGPSDADFDLYVTFDGRAPGPFDYDRGSYTQDSNEQIIVDDPGQVSEFGVLVYSYEGSGAYTLTTEEIGHTN